MSNLILGYKRGLYRCKAIQTALSKFQQKSTIITDDIAFVTDINGVCSDGVTLQTT